MEPPSSARRTDGRQMLKDFFTTRPDLWSTVVNTLGRRDRWQAIAKDLKLTLESVESIESRHQGNGLEQAKSFMETIRELSLSIEAFVEALKKAGLEELALRLQQQLEEEALAQSEMSSVWISFDHFEESSFLSKLRFELKDNRVTVSYNRVHGKVTIVGVEVSSKLAGVLKKLVEENRFLTEGVVCVLCYPGKASSPSSEVRTRLTLPEQPCIYGSPISRPRSFLDRSELRRVVTTLLTCGVCAIQGLGGIGKTTFANEVARDPRVSRSYAKIYWTTLGSEFKTNEERVARITSILSVLDENAPPSFANLEQARISLQRQTSRLSKKLLIVLDDVWSPTEVELLRGVQNIHLLMTTRSEEIAVAFMEAFLSHGKPEDCIMKLPYLDEGQALRLLLDTSKVKEDLEVETRAKVIRRCGGLPLAIQVIGSMVCRQPPLSSPWSTIEKLQKDFKIGNEKLRSTSYNFSLYSALGISARELDVDMNNSWQQLVIFPEDRWIPEFVIGLLWSTEEFDTRRFLDELCAKALLEKYEEKGVPYAMYRLHDVVRSFLQWRLRGSAGSAIAIHLRLIENYKSRMRAGDWTTGPLDPGGYLLHNLSLHYKEAHLQGDVVFYRPVLRGQDFSLDDYEVQLSWRIAAISVAESSKWNYIGDLFHILELLVKQPRRYPQEDLAILFLTIVLKYYPSLEDAWKIFRFGSSSSYGIFAESECFSVWGAASYGFLRLTGYLLQHGVKVLSFGRDSPLRIAAACHRSPGIVKQLLLPELIKEPPASIALVLMEDHSDMMLNAVHNLGYSRWQEVFPHMEISAIQKLILRPTFTSAKFLTGLHALGFDYNVALEPKFMANLLINGSEGAFSVLTSIGYHRWAEVWVVLVPQQVVEVVRKGDYRRAKLLYDLGYPKWDLIYYSFQAASICDAIDRLDQQRRLGVNRVDYQDVLKALKEIGYPNWKDVCNLILPERVIEWIRGKEDPRISLRCLQEIAYPSFQEVCASFTVNEVITFINECDWLRLECLQLMSYPHWSEVIQSLSVDDLRRLVSAATYGSCQTICFLGEIGVTTWDSIDPSPVASLFTSSLSTKSSEMLLSLRKVGYSRWKEVLGLVDPFQVAYLLIEMDDLKRSGSHNLGYSPETALATRCKFLLAQGYQGFQLLEDAVQDIIKKLASSPWA